LWTYLFIAYQLFVTLSSNLKIYLMKKIYFLTLVLLLSTISFGQVLITEIADPNNNAEARFIELYNMGATDVDFTEGNGWQIDKYLNGNSGVDVSIDLTGIIPAGGFYIIAYDNTPGTFQTVYGFAPDQLDTVLNGVAGSNGDDDLALVDGNDNIVDFFGVYDFDLDVNTDNSGTCAEYEDGRAERLTSVSGPSASFNESEWNIWADSTISGCTSHQNAPRTAPGDFDPGSWGTPTCSLSLFNTSATCDAITVGTDTYTATVDFTGGGMSSYTVTASSGTVDLSGGNPSTDASGTISVTGISEGVDVTISVTDGGLCDLESTITSAMCVPSLTLPIYEPFDYVVGESLNVQTDWMELNSGDDILIGGPGGLTYPGLAGGSQTGNHVSFDADGKESKIEFTAISSGTVYASFIINVTDQSAITDLTDGGYIAALAAGDTSYDSRFWIRPNPDASSSTYDISITNSSTGGPFSGTYNIGESVLIVISYAPGTGTVKGWVNPSSLGGVEPVSDFTELDATPASTIDRFLLRQDSTGETPFILLDELRIGQTWAEVTPQTLSNDDFASSNFSLYPNPVTNGSVTISSNSADAMQVQVYDVLGKVVKNEPLSNNMLDVSNLNTGLYIVKITQNQNSVTKKLVIK
jgi:hypothetical protein